MKVKNSMILVPIDFTEQSMVALKEAENLAKISDSKLTLISVIEESGFFARVFGDKSQDEVDKMKQVINTKLAEIAQSSEAKIGNDVNVITSRGKVSSKIVEASEMVNADLIVMGTEGNPKKIKKLIGSNAYKVVTTSKVPVITIKGDQHKNCDVIILPLDLEKETKEKVSNAIEFARIYDATIKVVTVIKSNLDEEAAQTLKNNLMQVYKFIRSKNVKCDGDILYKDNKAKVSDEILQYAQDNEADLIMIMTQQESDFTPHFIGSSAQKVIYHSRIPVMSIRPRVTTYSYELPN
ncbi:MAG: universal stress protein [Flavobacteriales bacterium]|jgi:nucleotide-binding universal stress UspA family protein|nr:universal stress protein [Flavobacteriales bacterium]